MRQQGQKAILEATAAQRAAERELARQGAAMKRAVAAGDADALANLNDQVRIAEQKVTKTKGEVERLKAEDIRPEDLKDALSAFDPVWEQLSPREQARVIRLLVARVDYDGGGGERVDHVQA